MPGYSRSRHLPLRLDRWRLCDRCKDVFAAASCVACCSGKRPPQRHWQARLGAAASQHSVAGVHLTCDASREHVRERGRTRGKHIAGHTTLAWRRLDLRSPKLPLRMAYKPPANLSKTFLDRPPPNWKDLTLKVGNAVKAVDAAVRSSRRQHSARASRTLKLDVSLSLSVLRSCGRRPKSSRRRSQRTSPRRISTFGQCLPSPRRRSSVPRLQSRSRLSGRRMRSTW